jgi:disulfide bond formation protein DsbB
MISALDKKAAALAFVLGVLTIAAAWASQLWGGLVPCELWNRLPLAVWYLAMLVVAAIFVWSVYLGAFHAGVEWKFWAGPTACTTDGSGALDMSKLSDLNAVKVVQCDQIQWQFLGISLAGYNALVSLVIVVLLGVALVDQLRRGRRGGGLFFWGGGGWGAA